VDVTHRHFRLFWQFRILSELGTDFLRLIPFQFSAVSEYSPTGMSRQLCSCGKMAPRMCLEALPPLNQLQCSPSNGNRPNCSAAIVNPSVCPPHPLGYSFVFRRSQWSFAFLQLWSPQLLHPTPGRLPPLFEFTEWLVISISRVRAIFFRTRDLKPARLLLDRPVRYSHPLQQLSCQTSIFPLCGHQISQGFP